MTEQNKEEKYPVSADEIHCENLVWETIVMKGSSPFYQKWFFKKEDFHCAQCSNAVNTVFMTTRSGVCRSCTYCGFTEHIGPVHSETGDELAILIEEKAVTVDEAWVILKKHKIRHPPNNLPQQKGGRKRRIEEE